MNPEKDSSMKNPEKDGLILRQPDALIRGKMYKVLKFFQEKSQFIDRPTGTYPIKLIAVYKDIGVKFYTFMPKMYDNKPADYATELNDKIEKKENLRIIFYGKVGVTNILEIMEDVDVVDVEKLEGLQAIEDAQRNQHSPMKNYSSPSKRKDFNDDEDSYSPKGKRANRQE